MNDLQYGKRVKAVKEEKGDNFYIQVIHPFAYVEIKLFHQKFIEHPGCAMHSARC